MTDEIAIEGPVDMHAHLRQGDMLRRVVPLAATPWAAVLAMPNTDPILDTPEAAARYRAAALAAAPAGVPFDVHPTLYFRTDYTRATLEAARRAGVLSVKFYPRGLTTNSAHGCDPGDPRVLDVLAILEDLGIPLNVHPEAPGYYHDRERLFGRYAREWATRFPRLTIILEHLSDRASLDLLDLPNVHATVTPQHLLTTGDDWFGPPFDPHLYCMPCVKRAEDRDALVYACMVGPHRDKIMAGTDSAPHEMPRKVDCGCAGVFSAPIALQLYAQAFEACGRLIMPDILRAFLSDNARRIYGITPPARTVRLVREPFTIPARYGDIVPMWAGRTIDWSIAR